ncbi:MAG: AAA family ATPase, partial [Chloroflexi bacterium]|nr:AAA family ATPase [Chloroflexota bacterium]
LTQEKMMVGTVSYMPPEQATGGEITPKADLYSLGAMLYEMVTGRPPFMGDDDIAIIGQHINTPPVAPQWHRPEIPATLDSLIMRLLSKNPAERPDSAGDVLSALTAIDATPREVPADVDGSESGSLDGMAGGVFVGRQREMDQLKASLENALSGRGRMVTLVGEPGIGKSRTALELETYAGLRNAQVLWGRCYEGGGAPPYWPWVQAIRSFVTSHEPQEVRSQMGSTASVIAEIVADVKERLPDVQPPPTLDDPESARFRLFDSVATFLKNAGNVQPIVLVLDDLHWADGPSLKMLEFVARELASSRVMLVGTYRDMELNRRHPLSVTLGDLTREHLFERVLLRGLTREDVSRFIEIAAGVVPPRGLIDAVHTQTEGNPLFVTETVRLLIQEGELGREDSSRTDSSWNIRIPEGVREVIGRRLDKLSERCNEVLTTASVIGRQFTLDQLNAVLEDTTEDRLLDVIDEGLASRTIEEMPEAVGLYQFTHALIQETLSGELSTTRKVRLHARIAEILESLYGGEASGHAEELVRHFSEAETILGPNRLIQYATLAGEQALDRYGFEDGVRYFEQAAAAMEGLPDSEVSARVLFGLGRAVNLSSSVLESPRAFGYLEQAFNIYKDLGQDANAIRAADIDLFYGLVRGAADLVDKALELTPPDSPERARLLIRKAKTALRERTDLHEANEALTEAKEIAKRIGDSGLERSALLQGASIAWTAVQFEDSLAITRQILAFGEALDDRQRFQALGNAANALMSTGGLGEVSELAKERVEIARRFRDKRSIELSLHVAQKAAIFHGEYADAVKMGEEIEEIDPGEIVGVSQTIFAYQPTGSEVDLETLIAASKAHLPQSDSPLRLVHVFISPATVLAFNARHYGALERLPDAEELLDAAETAHGVLPLHRMVASVARAFTAAASSNLVACEAAYDELLQHRGLFDIFHFVSVDRVLGLLAGITGRHGDAEQHFEEAFGMCHTGGYRPELAWTCSDYAEMLLDRNEPGDREKATELQDE